MRQPGERAPAPSPLVLVQDLLNTADLEGGREGLRNPGDLTAFCHEHGLDALTFDHADVSTTTKLREALRDACSAHAGHELPDSSATVLAQQLACAVLVLHLDQTGQARVVPGPGLTGFNALLAHCAAAIATAEADGSWRRLKACSANQCRWAYYDRSPAGRSKWCTMSICGSKAKMRTYRTRAASRTTMGLGI